MIQIDVPGWRNLMIEQVICDFNGTLATDGALEEGVAERLIELSKLVKIVILTADTHGTVSQALAELPVTIEKVDPGAEAMSKRYALDGYGTLTSAFIGNGANDEKAIGAAALGIAVIGREGVFPSTLTQANLVVFRPEDALDLLLHPKRVVAGLRR